MPQMNVSMIAQLNSNISFLCHLQHLILFHIGPPIDFFFSLTNFVSWRSCCLSWAEINARNNWQIVVVCWGNCCRLYYRRWLADCSQCFCNTRNNQTSKLVLFKTRCNVTITSIMQSEVVFYLYAGLLRIIPSYCRTCEWRPLFTPRRNSICLSLARSCRSYDDTCSLTTSSTASISVCNCDIAALVKRSLALHSPMRNSLNAVSRSPDGFDVATDLSFAKAVWTLLVRWTFGLGRPDTWHNQHTRRV